MFGVSNPELFWFNTVIDVLEHCRKLLHCIGRILEEKEKTRWFGNSGIGVKAQEKKRDRACCMHFAQGLVADCAFPPFWLWLSLSPGNSAQTEKRGGGTKGMTETDQDQEEVSEIEKEMKWCSVTSLIGN